MAAEEQRLSNYEIAALEAGEFCDFVADTELTTGKSFPETVEDMARTNSMYDYRHFVTRVANINEPQSRAIKGEIIDVPAEIAASKQRAATINRALSLSVLYLAGMSYLGIRRRS